MSDWQTSSGSGCLILGQREVATRYTLYRDSSGRPVMIELLDRPQGAFSDEAVRVVLADRGELTCQILDDTGMCSVIAYTPMPAQDASDL